MLAPTKLHSAPLGAFAFPTSLSGAREGGLGGAGSQDERGPMLTRTSSFLQALRARETVLCDAGGVQVAVAVAWSSKSRAPDAGPARLNLHVLTNSPGPAERRPACP